METMARMMETPTAAGTLHGTNKIAIIQERCRKLAATPVHAHKTTTTLIGQSDVASDLMSNTKM
jgi:hypothetical protein